MPRDFQRQLSSQHRDARSLLERWLHIDMTLLVLLLLLCGTGLLVLFSANGRDWAAIERQLAFMAVGLVLMLLVARISQYTWQRLAPGIYTVCLLLLVAVFFFGAGAKGAERWLDLPGLPRFQPSELAKLAVPLMLAAYLDHRPLPPGFKHVAWSLLLLLLPVALIAEQPDLGSALLVAASAFVVLFIAGLQWRYIVGAIVAMIPVAIVMWMYVMHDYQRKRILTLLNPETDKLGAGWNILQSTTAIGSGGWTGKGWLEGTQSHLDFLPESHTDFIIAVFSEEFGFLGILTLLVLYLSITGRCLWISAHAQDGFGRLLGTSLTMAFFVYVFVNMGMVSGILPVVGVPLPMISQGGTAVVSMMIGFGFLMSIATEQRKFNG
jgi:rod shape determining protein RodA